MAQYITWDTCYYSVASQHFNAAYANYTLLIAALGFFFLYYLLRFGYQHPSKFVDFSGLKEERAEALAQGFIMGGVFCVLAYVVWFCFFFRPDAVQASVEHMKMVMAGIPPAFQGLL